MNSQSKKRSAQPKVGDVFLVDLRDGKCAFGIVAAGKDYAFFDLFSEHVPPIEEIVGAGVAFRVPVFHDAIAKGRWPIIGNVKLKGPLAEISRYHHRPVGSTESYMYSGGETMPATADEVAGLELLAVWTAEHVEQRLRDFSCGRPNELAERFRH